MKVYLAILLFSVAAILFVQQGSNIGSNICLGCQNGNSQIVEDTGKHFQFVSRRFLGSSQPAPSYNSNVPTIQSGQRRSLGAALNQSFNNSLNNLVNQTPLRNLGNRSSSNSYNQINRNTAQPSAELQAPIQQSDSFERSLSDSVNGYETIETPIQPQVLNTNPYVNSTQLRSLGNTQTVVQPQTQSQALNQNNLSQIDLNQTDISQSNVNQTQLRQLSGTFDNQPSAFNPLPTDNYDGQTITGEQAVNPTITDSNTQGSEQNTPQLTIQDTVQNTNQNTSQNTLRNLDPSVTVISPQSIDTNSQETSAIESSKSDQGTVHNFSDNQVQIPLMVPEVSESEEADSITIEVLDTPRVEIAENVVVENVVVENEVGNTQEQANRPSLLEGLRLPQIRIPNRTRTATPEVKSDEPTPSDSNSNKLSGTPALAAPLTSINATDIEAAVDTVDVVKDIQANSNVTIDNSDTSVESESVEAETQEVNEVDDDSVGSSPSETQPSETEQDNSSNVLAPPIDTTETTEALETTSETEQIEEQVETTTDETTTQSDVTQNGSEEETTEELATDEPLEEDTKDETTEELAETNVEPTQDSEESEEVENNQNSEEGTSGIALPNVGATLPNQNITPNSNTDVEETDPKNSEPESLDSETTTDSDTKPKETEPEESTHSETTPDTEEAKPEESEIEEPVETPETPDEVEEKLKLEDIAVDSEIDYWNDYFAKNAKSYDDIVAISKENNSPLLIVDAMQGESGSACDLENPCSFITALAQLKSGGTILIRKGDYELRQRISITRSGTKTSPIVIRNYPEENVVISGKRLSGSGADAGLINISDQKHIRIQGLELTNYSSSKNFGTVAAIMLRRSASNIEIIQNHIHDIRTLAPKNNTSALGIAIYGTSPKEPMRDILIQGNHVHDLTLGFSESISLSGNVDGFRIEGNQVHDVDNIGIVVAGGYGTACWESANRNSCDDSLDYARNGLVMGNTVYNVDTRKNSAYPDSSVNAAAGIYVDGARTIVVERNRVYSNGSGFSISSENAGGLAKDIIVRNNLIYNNHRTGMNLGAENAQKGRVDNLTVTNNTFYNNDLTSVWGGEIFMEYDVDNSLITNNIFYADNYIYDAANDVDIDINLIINDGLPTDVSGSENNQLLSNIYHGKGVNRTWQWQGKWYNHESFEAFLEASGDKLDEAEGSFDADPGFAFLPEIPDEQVGQIRLEPSLINPPSKNRAFPLSSSIVGDLDKAANPRLNDDALDIGAYEH